MCASHQYVSPSGTVWVDRCTNCVRAANTAQHNQQEETKAAREEYVRTLTHAVAAMARALVRAGSPGLQSRYKMTVQRKTRFLRDAKLVEHAEEVAPGWAAGERQWGYRPRDLDVRVPTGPVYRSDEWFRSLPTWVLEDGRLVYDGELDGQDIRFMDNYDAVLRMLTSIANSHGVEIPWDVQELLPKLQGA